MPAQLSFSSCISSVRDEIQRINSQKATAPDIWRSGQVPQFPRKGDEAGEQGEAGDVEDAPVGLVHPLSDSPISTVSDSETSSNVSGVSAATTGSRCERARKGDLYTMANDEEVSRIVAEINAGHLVSNTKCAPWGPGSKHNPNHPDTLRVRCQISAGPKTRDQITSALPTISKKLIGSILHELREQGIVSVKRSGKK
jgi:hypothetical protein